MKLRKSQLLIGAVFFVTGCVTPMGAGEIQSLTTCRNTDMQAIRKNLLMSGYEIKSESATDLVTDFKQVGGYGRERALQRITVVKVDESTFRFNVRLRDVRVERDSGRGMSVTNSDPKRQQSSTVTIDLSQPVEVTQDTDRSYYQEHADKYAQTQQEVCGG